MNPFTAEWKRLIDLHGVPYTKKMIEAVSAAAINSALTISLEEYARCMASLQGFTEAVKMKNAELRRETEETEKRIRELRSKTEMMQQEA